MAGTTRRQVVVGSAMLALSSAGFTHSHAVEHCQDAELIRLGIQLEQQKRDVRRLHRHFQQNASDRNWRTWSDACSALADLCEQIARVHPTTLQGVAIRFEAFAVGLLDDDAIVDEAVRRQAAMLRTSLARLARA